MAKIKPAAGAKRMVPTPESETTGYVIEVFDAKTDAWVPNGDTVPRRVL